VAADAPNPIASARLEGSKLTERIAADAAIATGIARIVYLQVPHISCQIQRRSYIAVPTKQTI
jgi:hypothetical protein